MDHNDSVLLIATRNPGKTSEFRDLFADFPWRVQNLVDLPDIPDVEETGKTFRANACLKASRYAHAAGTWALADDSGLEVDALDGAPGVHSARFAAMNNAGSGDVANNQLLLQKLRDVPTEHRGAQFVCVLALANPAGDIILTTRGTVAGLILCESRGTNGFGYDSLFLIRELGKTTAELSVAEKHRISHRGRAMKDMKALLDRVGIRAS